MPDQTKPAALPPKEEKFCCEYIKDRNGTHAYIRAGYSPTGARANASRLIAKDNVRWRINELISEELKKIKLDANFIIRELLKHATIDISDVYDDEGNLLPLYEMPEPLRKAIVGIDIEEEYSGKGADRKIVGYTKRIKFTDKIKAIELLGRHLKMFTDVHEIAGLAELADRIKLSRERAEKDEG